MTMIKIPITMIQSQNICLDHTSPNSKFLLTPNILKSILSLPQDPQHQHLSDSFTMTLAITS